MNLGALAAKVGQPAREQDLPDRVAGAQPQVHAPRSSGELDQLREAVERLERALGRRIDRAAELGRAHPEPSTLEQPAADTPLEHLDSLRHGRLGQLQRVGGAVNASCLDRRDERGQLTTGQRVRDRRHRCGHRRQT